MPKRNDIKKILIIGAGPIVIGQACEFDYSGAQACKSLREEGYEIVLIINPVLSEVQVKETTSKLATLLKDAKAKIIHEENWGLKKLKYAIQKKKTGFYYMMEFEASGSILQDFEIEVKRDERVLRWLTVRLDKYALEYAEVRKRKMVENKEKSN